MYILTVIHSHGTTTTTHATLCRALAVYDMTEPDGLDLLAMHHEAGTRGHYVGISSRGSIVTLARNVH